MILADLGAEVIHIEPRHGDDAREFGPFAGKIDKNHSAYFASLNRNKKSMVLNLKHEEGKEILRHLIRISDVIIENFKPETRKALADLIESETIKKQPRAGARFWRGGQPVLANKQHQANL